MGLEARRIALHEKLCEVLGSRHVYYDPPPTVSMRYPAIVYEKSAIDTTRADNGRYLGRAVYKTTLIRKDDDDDILDRLLDLEYCSFAASFTSEGLHHDVLNIYI